MHVSFLRVTLYKPDLHWN